MYDKIFSKIYDEYGWDYFSLTMGDAISKWIATVHAVGITKENNEIKVYAPYGLSDIFSKTIRPIKHETNSKKLYDKKAESWNRRFNNLTIIEW